MHVVFDEFIRSRSTACRVQSPVDIIARTTIAAQWNLHLPSSLGRAQSKRSLSCPSIDSVFIRFLAVTFVVLGVAAL